MFRYSFWCIHLSTNFDKKKIDCKNDFFFKSSDFFVLVLKYEAALYHLLRDAAPSFVYMFFFSEVAKCGVLDLRAVPFSDTSNPDGFMMLLIL